MLTRYGGLTLAYGAGLLVALGALALGAAKLPPQPNPHLTGWSDPRGTRDGRALVVGCGYGDDAEWLAAQGHEVTAFDIAPTAVRRCRERFPASRVNYVTADLLSPPPEWLETRFDRYVQTPTGAGYGVHGSVITSGLVLVPFSVASFLGSRVASRVPARLPKETLIPIAGGLVLLAALLFASARGSLWNVLLVMGITGAGVGLLFATIPAMIVAAIPAAQTTGAVGFNQVARTVGVTAGSALCGIILQAATPAGQAIPRSSGYTTAALIAAGALVAMIAAATLALILTRRQSRSAAPAVNLRGAS